MASAGYFNMGIRARKYPGEMPVLMASEGYSRERNIEDAWQMGVRSGASQCRRSDIYVVAERCRVVRTVYVEGTLC